MFESLDRCSQGRRQLQRNDHPEIDGNQEKEAREKNKDSRREQNRDVNVTPHGPELSRRIMPKSP